MEFVDPAFTVEEFLGLMSAHEWDEMAECLSDDVIRVGPYGDVYRGKREYVTFLEGVLPALAEYRMDVARVVEAGAVVVAELSETVAVDGRPRRTPEALVFDLDGEGRIARIAVYTQDGHDPGEPP